LSQVVDVVAVVREPMGKAGPTGQFAEYGL
jgi:hypothetical protein